MDFLRSCLVAGLYKLIQIRLTRFERSVSQLAAKQLVPQPEPVCVDHVAFAVVSDVSQRCKATSDLGTTADIGRRYGLDGSVAFDP